MRRLLAAAVLLCVARPAFAETKWTMVRTPTLTVIGDQSPATLRDIAIQLEQFRTVVAGLIAGANRPPSLPTNVFVFGTRAAMRPYLPMANGRIASLAGYFQRDGDVNTIALTVERMDESAAIAYHEYAHLLLGSAVRTLPVWLNEGLAEYYSTYRLVDGGKEAQIGRPPEGRLVALREDSLPMSSVIEVDRSSTLYNEGDRRSLFYAQAWAMVHYVLTQMPHGGEAINQYVESIAEGRPPHEAFLAAFGRTAPNFDGVLRLYAQRPSFAGTRFTFREKVATAEPGPPRTLSLAETNAWLGDLQRRVGREAEAAPRIDAAAASDPEASIARLAAGLLRFAQERTNEGLLEMERAAALAPDDFQTQYLHGVWMLRVDAAGSTEHSDAAARALTRAVALRPESSDAHAWLAYAQMQKAATLADAQRSIERAIELAPGRADHRLRWADIRILQGAYDDARTLLTQIAGIRNDQRAAEGAQQRLDRMQSLAGAPATRPVVRALRVGEERVAGRLTRIDCLPDGVRFHVDAGDREIVSKPADLDSVELISYLNDKDFRLECGVRAERDPVYLTLLAGVAVAVEFLPKGFIP